MKKYLLFVTLMIVGLCLLGTPAQAAYYDAININIAGTTGSVSGTVATPQAPGLGNNWYNITSGDGKYLDAGTMTGLATSNGTAVSGLSIGFYDADVYEGGGGSGGFTASGGADGTLLEIGWGNTGHMRVDTIRTVPFTSYDMWVLTERNGWEKWSATAMDDGITSFYIKPRATDVGVSAVQYLSTNPEDAPPAGAVPEPAGLGLIGVTLLAASRFRKRRS